MKDGKVGFGLIGAGRAGMIHAVNMNTEVENGYMVAVCDPMEENRQESKRILGIEKVYKEYEDILKDEEVDAVIIATPTKYHCEIAVAAAKAGKDILCEKPLAMTEEECEIIERVVKERKVKFQIGFMRRFDRSFMEAKRLVEEGAIGKVVMIRSNTRGPSTPKPWMYDISKSNGPLAEVNSHDFDTVRWFAESEPMSIYSIAGNYRCPEAKAEFPDFYDNVVSVMKMENGVQAIVDGAQGVQYGYDARAEILGEKGCIFIGEKNSDKVVICTDNKKQSRQFVESWKNLFHEAYIEEDKRFVESILNNEEVYPNARDGKMAVKIVNAGNKSIKEQKIIEIK